MSKKKKKNLHNVLEDVVRSLTSLGSPRGWSGPEGIRFVGAGIDLPYVLATVQPLSAIVSLSIRAELFEGRMSH